MTDPNTFPYVPQSIYADIPEGPLVGDLWEDSQFARYTTRALVARVTPVSQITEVTIGANNPGDSVGVTIDGGTVEVTAGANAGATALLLEAALEAAAFLSSKLDSVTVAGVTATINFSDFDVHTVEEFSPDATTATVNTTQAAVGQQKIEFGMGVARKLPITTANNTSVVKPTSTTDNFAGVIFRTPGSDIPEEQKRLKGYDVGFICPGRPYALAKEKLGVVVKYFGSAPNVGDPVYWIAAGPNAGWWRTDDGGTSEVVTYTVTTSAADNIAFNIDGYPTLSIAATNNAINDAASLVALWNGSPFYTALGTVVDNLDGTFTVTYADRTSHVLTDESTGANAVAASIDVAAVAAVAVLRPEYSWGHPSITAGDPTRAFLRLTA